jgi:hypothetical protein
MRLLRLLILLIACAGCIRQPSLPASSVFNVTARLNDSLWYGTGKILRVREEDQRAEEVKKVNLLVFTDIDYPGMGEGQNPNTSNGCLDPECTRTQHLFIFNIPLKKGRYDISKLDKNGTLPHEKANLGYMSNSGGVLNRYVDGGLKPAWIRITRFDKKTGVLEGRFELVLEHDKNAALTLQGRMPETAHFRNGLFRIKVTDVLVK